MKISADTLIELARAARDGATQHVLEAVAETLCAATGFECCVVNVFRPAWDDFEAVVTKGPKELRELLLGQRIPAAEIYKLLKHGDQRVEGIYFVAADNDVWESFEHDYFVPEVAQVDHPDAWLAEDALLLMLHDGSREPLGMITLDQPASGLRPAADEMELMRVIVQYAEQALETAMLSQLRDTSAKLSTALLRTANELARCSTGDELNRATFQIIDDYLGFERAALYAIRADDPELRLRTASGWEGASGRLPDTLEPGRVIELLRPEEERSGTWLLAAQQLFADQPPGERSRRNGRGKRGWQDHCLVVPVRHGSGRLRAIFVLEDPVDHAIPSETHRQAVRVMVDQAAVAQSLLVAREELTHLATHDPLTGLRNRRGLDAEILRHDDVAVLICDLDHFKEINDRFGHASGDHVLREFGELLRAQLRDDDVAIRIGGEEFCLVLPHTDRTGALEVAERLRKSVEKGLADTVPGGVTVSIGVAAASDGMLSVHNLLAEADRGVYVAKRTGRNRVARDERRR